VLTFKSAPEHILDHGALSQLLPHDAVASLHASFVGTRAETDPKLVRSAQDAISRSRHLGGLQGYAIAAASLRFAPVSLAFAMDEQTARANAASSDNATLLPPVGERLVLSMFNRGQMILPRPAGRLRAEQMAQRVAEAGSDYPPGHPRYRPPPPDVTNEPIMIVGNPERAGKIAFTFKGSKKIVSDYRNVVSMLRPVAGKGSVGFGIFWGGVFVCLCCRSSTDLTLHFPSSQFYLYILMYCHSCTLTQRGRDCGRRRRLRGVPRRRGLCDCRRQGDGHPVVERRAAVDPDDRVPARPDGPLDRRQRAAHGGLAAV
jgi:hypothetical protein